jgi:hypothetical protein
MGLPIGSAPDPLTIDDDGLHPKGSDGIHNEWIPFRPVIAASLHHSLQPTYRLQQSVWATIEWLRMGLALGAHDLSCFLSALLGVS